MLYAIILLLLIIMVPLLLLLTNNNNKKKKKKENNDIYLSSPASASYVSPIKQHFLHKNLLELIAQTQNAEGDICTQVLCTQFLQL